jgi:seryl-tRNA synthetase
MLLCQPRLIPIPGPPAALINYGLHFLKERSYKMMSPPFFMNKESMAGVAQLADFDEQLYKVRFRATCGRA